MQPHDPVRYSSILILAFMDIFNQVRPVLEKSVDEQIEDAVFNYDFAPRSVIKYKYTIQLLTKYPRYYKNHTKNQKKWRTRASIPLPLEIKKLNDNSCKSSALPYTRFQYYFFLNFELDPLERQLEESFLSS